MIILLLSWIKFRYTHFSSLHLIFFYLSSLFFERFSAVFNFFLSLLDERFFLPIFTLHFSVRFALYSIQSLSIFSNFFISESELQVLIMFEIPKMRFKRIEISFSLWIWRHWNKSTYARGKITTAKIVYRLVNLWFKRQSIRDWMFLANVVCSTQQLSYSFTVFADALLERQCIGICTRAFFVRLVAIWTKWRRPIILSLFTRSVTHRLRVQTPSTNCKQTKHAYSSMS